MVLHSPQYKVGSSHTKALLYALKKSFAREQNFISNLGNIISSLGNNISNLGNNISSLEITFSSREKRFCQASKMIFCRIHLIFYPHIMRFFIIKRCQANRLSPLSRPRTKRYFIVKWSDRKAKSLPQNDEEPFPPHREIGQNAVTARIA